MEKMQRRRFKKTYTAFSVNIINRLWFIAFNNFSTDNFSLHNFRNCGTWASSNCFCIIWFCEWVCSWKTLYIFPWVKLAKNYNISFSFLSFFYTLYNDYYEFDRWRLLSKKFWRAFFIHYIILLTFFG